MRVVALAAVLALCASQVGAQGYEPVKVRTCPYADSLLGPLRDDHKSEVLAHQQRDSTFLLVRGERNRPPRMNVSIKMQGERPTRDPAAQLAVYVRGGDAKKLPGSVDALPVTVVLNDSITVQPAATALGTFIGPERMMVIPVSALIRSDDFVTLTQSRKIVVNAGHVTVPLSNEDRRSMRAILRVAVCPP